MSMAEYRGEGGEVGALFARDGLKYRWGGGGFCLGQFREGKIPWGEHVNTPPMLVQGHQTRETSTPPTFGSLWTNQFCETLASEIDSLSIGPPS